VKPLFRCSIEADHSAVPEAYQNKSFYTGRPLIKQSLEKASGPMQYEPDTTEAAKAIARVMNAGNNRMPLANPIVTDEFLRQWAGPAPYYILRAVEMPWKTGGRPWEFSDLPFAGAFIARQPSPGALSIQDFYTEADKFEVAHADLQLALRHANPAEIARNATMQSAVRMTMFKNALTGQSQALQGIDQNPQMTNAEKRKYTDIITGQMIATAQAGLKTMQAVEGAAARSQGHRAGQ
jgi:hypothetical protein